MKTELTSFPALGIDTVQVLSPASCARFKSLGMSFVLRYLHGRYRVTKDELAGILSAGMAFMPVTPSRAPGWNPSRDIGKMDANAALVALGTLNATPGLTIWLDFEGATGPVSAVEDWINEWSFAVVSQGFEAGLYVGQGSALDAERLWKLPHVTRYWKSCSRVEEPAKRGWCMQQLRPWDVRINGVIVDVDVIGNDYLDDRPSWLIG